VTYIETSNVNNISSYDNKIPTLTCLENPLETDFVVIYLQCPCWWNDYKRTQ